MAEKKEQDIFYVGLRSPEDIRRDLLEGTKSIINLLQDHDKLRRTRTKKIDEIFQLRKLIKELNILNARLLKEFPETKLRNLPKVKIADEKPFRGKEMGRRGADEEVKKSKTDLDKLEEELAFLENKLGKVR